MILQLVATTVLRTLNDLRSQQFSQLIHVRSPYFVRARLSPGVVGKAFVLNCLCRLRARKDKKDSKYISALVGAPLKEVCRGPSKLLNPRKRSNSSLQQEIWRPPFEPKFVDISALRGKFLL